MMIPTTTVGNVSPSKTFEDSPVRKIEREKRDNHMSNLKSRMKGSIALTINSTPQVSTNHPIFKLDELQICTDEKGAAEV